MQIILIDKKAFIWMDQYRWYSNVVGTCNDVWMMLLPSHSKHEWGEVTSGSGGCEGSLSQCGRRALTSPPRRACAPPAQGEQPPGRHPTRSTMCHPHAR